MMVTIAHHTSRTQNRLYKRNGKHKHAVVALAAAETAEVVAVLARWQERPLAAVV